MAKRGVTLEDLYAYQLVGNPRISPDGKWVVYEQTTLNRKTDEYETQLVLASTDGSTRRHLSTSGTRNFGAEWSPDGQHIAFLSSRYGGVPQLFILPFQGGEATRVTRFQNGLSNISWAPDGETVVGLTPVTDGEDIPLFAEDLSAKEAEEANQKRNKEWAEGPKRYNRLYYKGDGVGLSKLRESQLVAIQIRDGSFVQLTAGPYPVGSYDVSPDGRYVAFTCNRRPDRETNPRHADVYRVPLGGGEAERLHDDVHAYSVRYNPDGSTIAILGNRHEFESATHTHLYTIPADGGEAFQWTTDFPDTLGDVCLSDMKPDVRGGLRWTQDGKKVYVLSTREGRTELVRFFRGADGGAAHEVVVGGDRQVYGFDFADESTVVISYATATDPGRIAVVPIAGTPTKQRHFRAVTEHIEINQACFPGNETRLDDANVALFQEVGSVEPISFEYRSQDDWTAQGWVLKPFDYEEGKKYPVILDIHGGPQMMYGHGYFHEMQWFAAQGYAVVYVNPRGSMGYGQEFVNAVRHHYGEGDAADVLNGLEAAIAQFDFLDGTRVGVTGGSYGGFMTNWLVGHTDRFFAAVAQRSISNWFSFYGVSDIGPLFVEAQIGGDVFSNPEGLWRMSPLAYAPQIHTPLLLLHSEQDLRCPIEQAEQLYTAIKRRGGEVELFRIPNASHGLSRNGKPKLRVARLEAIFGWIDSHLPGKAQSEGADA
ncbi:MAG: S9 family peptidase [Alicyclobacillus sp.]|nr:S9 family peptidase [Alicyclobacillus sp.]